MRYYAIGDIHGCLNMLEDLLESVYKRHEGTGDGKVIFLGDYVDRGPDSKGVIDLIRAGSKDPTLEFIALMGNHERMMLEYYDQGSLRTYFRTWLVNGGDETMESFQDGYNPAGDVPREYLDWADNLLKHYETEDYYFVHAGVMPGIPLSEQVEDDKLWIRGQFLSSDYDWGKTVIHGHTPDIVSVRNNQINVDTGAVFDGVLSCVVLTEGKRPYINENGKVVNRPILLQSKESWQYE